jgi:hypothetical protein
VDDLLEDFDRALDTVGAAAGSRGEHVRAGVAPQRR